MAQPTTVYVSGKGARLFFGTFEVGFKKFTVTENVAEGDTTSSMGRGFMDQETGPTGLEIDVECDADSANNPWDNGLGSGSVILNVSAYLNGSGGPSWSISQATLLTPVNTVGIKDPVVIGYNFKLKSKGPYNRPTGDFGTFQ